MLTPHRYLRYSGTVPGWISGQYARDHGTVDVAALAERAGAALVLDWCEAIDPEARTVTTRGGEQIAFDIASFDTGGVGRAREVLDHDPRLIDIRPIERFVEHVADIEPPVRIAVVGGGAGGTELAMGLRNWKGAATRPQVTFAVGKEGLVPELSGAVRNSIGKELERQGIVVIAEDARFEEGALMAGGQSLEPVELIVAALGSAAPDWPHEGGLVTDEDGFIAVDAHQRSTSHPHLFAVGDVAARQDRHIPHSGVHAVFAGPLLADNLRRVMADEEPSQTYTPRWNNLYLLSTGKGEAIASYGPFSAKGRWVSKLKHWIDNRWISKYARLAQDQ